MTLRSLFVAVWLCLLGLPSCYTPYEPICSFRCGDNAACPANYQCLADNYCHLHGQAGDCGYPDLKMPDQNVADLSMPEDGPPSTDGPSD